jgi:hypothetical protein
VPAVVEALVLKYVALTHDELQESCLHKLSYMHVMSVIKHVIFICDFVIFAGAGCVEALVLTFAVLTHEELEEWRQHELPLKSVTCVVSTCLFAYYSVIFCRCRLWWRRWCSST